MASLGDRVRQRRDELGISQSELARRVGVTPQSIQSLERGRTRTFRQILALAEALEIGVDRLTYGLDARDRPYRQAPNDDLASTLRDFGARVREAREQLGLGQAAAARGIMRPAEWRDLEQGRHFPDPVALDLMCGRLQQSLDWLVRGIVIASGEIPKAHQQPATLHSGQTQFQRATTRTRRDAKD